MFACFVQPHTHVISSIVFLGAEYDNPDEEWPIQIEDHDGKLHEVNLKPGQVASNESCKYNILVCVFCHVY